MFSFFILKDKIDYDGSQLRSHFILEKTGHYGNGAVSFIGAADVKIGHMVDLEDVLGEDFIYSPEMLHFILEFFPADLSNIVLWQRLFLLEIYKLLVAEYKLPFILDGDDLYLSDKKLSVSIATVSGVSSLIHTALNIKTENTPVKTVGLKELQIEPVELAEKVLHNFQKEYNSILKAISKVRSVP
jgi:hypothetical protein